MLTDEPNHGHWKDRCVIAAAPRHRLLAVRRKRLFKTIFTLLVWYLYGSRLIVNSSVDFHKQVKVAQDINSKLANYDMRLRPGFSGNATRVGLDLSITSFDKISEVNMDYTITLTLDHYWIDERLNYSGDGITEINLGATFAKKIWVPDIYFDNDKNSYIHQVAEDNKALIIYENGTIFYGMRITSTLACMMDLRSYPLDTQECSIEIESYGYTTDELEMYWFKEPSKQTWKHELPQFQLLDVKATDREDHFPTGVYPKLSLSFRMKRNIGYFLFQTYLPSILIVMLSWVSFWITHEATSARVALGITTVLTITTISTGVRSSLPRISYVKAIDIYLVMCFIFVFGALLEYAVVNYSYWGEKAKRKASKEKTAETRGRSRNKDDDEIGKQDIVMSPILSLRSRQGRGKRNPEIDAKHPPSIQFSGVDHSYAYPHRSAYNLAREVRRHRRVFENIKRSANCWKKALPKIRDVNIVDKYSRIIFPTSFFIFNIVYWSHYLIQH